MHQPIPATRYTSSRWLAAEWSSVFARSWLLGAHCSELAEVGSFVRVRFGRHEIVLVRQSDLSARAFHGICQHRGTPLCVQETGRVQSLVCPYHRWEYALDGSLVSAPGAGLSQESIAQIALGDVQCEERLGFVWFRLTDVGPSLDEHLSPVADAIAAYRPEEFRLANGSAIAMAANWKAVLDANNEAYHLGTLHPALMGIVEPTLVRDETFGIHSGSTVVLGEGISPRSDGSLQERTRAALASMGVQEMPATCEAIPHAIAAAAAQGLMDCGVALPTSVTLSHKRQFAVFPNVQLNFTPLRLEVYRQWPHTTDPSQSEFEELSYLRPANAPSTPTRKRGPHGTFSVGEVLDADLEIATQVQRGMATGALDSVRLTCRESNVAHFHQTIGEFVRRAEVERNDVSGDEP